VRVEAPGLRLCQCRLLQLEVSLLLSEQDILIPQHLVEAEGVLRTGGVGVNIFKVLFTSSLGLYSVRIKVLAHLDQGSLGDPDFLLPCHKGLHVAGEHLLSVEELLL
jgi:hypothetical protein